MGWIEGITDVCALSATCKLDWEAWDAVGGIAAAIGTFVAVFVALRISSRDTRRAERDRKDRARGLHLLLIQPLRHWRSNLHDLLQHIDRNHPIAILESFEEEGGDVLCIPMSIDEHLMRAGDLGEAGLPLSLAIHRARSAKDMEGIVLSALRGDMNNDTASKTVLRGFRFNVAGAHDELAKAVELMDKELGIRPPKGSVRVVMQPPLGPHF